MNVFSRLTICEYFEHSYLVPRKLKHDLKTYWHFQKIIIWCAVGDNGGIAPYYYNNESIGGVYPHQLLGPHGQS